ncbi:MAG: sulfatase activating formylglycine-generating enzyme [Gammaproteobacteria bacterium]|jgi:formylglycine-generating enzyme required for sulfatase activity
MNWIRRAGCLVLFPVWCPAVFFTFLVAFSNALMANPGFHPPATVFVPPGVYLHGSTSGEREAGYQLDEAAYGHRTTRDRQWYADEPLRHQRSLAGFHITSTPITNAQFAQFVDATGHRAPNVAPETWRGYGLVHPYSRTRRHAWVDGQAPRGRELHPVVLISYDDASAYAQWLTSRTGMEWRIPTEQEWEKAARGVDGRRFPWGNLFDPNRLNSHDAGPFDTVPVGRFPLGASPFGLQDAAGQVFEWTASPAGNSRAFVKGGSWDDSGCGICRPAARHTRPKALRHILIGFRVAHD